MSEETVTDVLEELARLPTLAHPTVAPGGKEIAVYYDATGRNELHVLDTETGELEQWSNGEVPRNARWFLRWDGGDRVYFHRDDSGDEQNDIYALSRAGEVEPVVKMDGQAVLNDVSDDGNVLLVGSSRDGQMNIYRHDIPAGETTKLTEYERAAGGATIGPDGERFAFSTNESDDYDNRDIYVADIDGSNVRNLEVGEVGAEVSPADWGPESDRLLVKDNTEDLSRIGIYDLREDAVRWLGGGEHEESAAAFGPDGERVLGTRTREAETVPIVYDLATGESREFDLPDGVAGFSLGDPFLADGRVVLTHTTPTTRSELVAYDLETDETETLIGPEYGPFSPEQFADAEYLTIESNGVPETSQQAVEHDPYESLEIGALLYDSGERPSPLIVNPHGGPRSRDSKRFDLYTQVLVARGFSVLKVNYRGSTGRGREFVEELYDDWGGAEQGDVATAAEHVLDTREWLDENRVAVFGGSYGGYSAYWQLIQYPELYAAGIAWIGLTDLEEMYETTMPHFRTELMEKYLGDPADNADLYRERSPIEYAKNLSTPLLMVHGVNDHRVPVGQARVFRDRLEEFGYEAGAEFEYEELGEEGHASSDQEQKLRLFRLLDDFLDRRIGTEPALASDD